MDRDSAPLGLYIHVPFCRGKCPYCDFYSLPFADELADAYTAAVLRALEQYPVAAAKADTLYFGGGTPSLLGSGRLCQILEAAARRFGLEDAEITLEANPGDALETLLPDLRRAGFNRVSLGVQSAHDGELEALGRRHRWRDAQEAVLAASVAGFNHISADLMLGIPLQTEASLGESLQRLTRLPVTHISAYLLKREEGTPFGEQRESPRFPDEDAQAAYYLQTVGLLEQAGFAQYEISNFAKNGWHSRHNLKYWQGAPYLGIGPAAHSFVEGKRFFFPRDLQRFIDAENPFTLRVEDGTGGDLEERFLLALRLKTGVDADALPLSSEARQRLLQKAALLAQNGLVHLTGRRFSLTPRGFLLSNSVTAALIHAISA